MYADTCGDMGFLESMIAMMAVITVLMAFLGVSTHTAVVITDPTDGLDPDMMDGRIVDGEFVPGFGEYIADYCDSRGLNGISVTVLVPGGYCEGIPPLTVGEMDGRPFTRTLTSIIPLDDGRSVTAVFEVTVCV